MRPMPRGVTVMMEKAWLLNIILKNLSLQGCILTAKQWDCMVLLCWVVRHFGIFLSIMQDLLYLVRLYHPIYIFKFKRRISYCRMLIGKDCLILSIISEML